MLPDERKTRILQLAESNGFVSLQQLVDAIGASESTLRRDLDTLHAAGQVRRTRGGAAFAGESLTDFRHRQSVATDAKRQIAAAMAALIQPQETLLLDGGTTTLEVARQLTGIPLTVVTNSFPIAHTLMNRPEIELIFIGGYVYPKTGVALGPEAVAALKRIRVHRLVLSTEGITADGLFNSNQLLVDTERAMLAAADNVSVVADSSKLGRSALANLCSLDKVDSLTVDDGITDEWKTELETAGVEVHVAAESAIVSVR